MSIVEPDKMRLHPKVVRWTVYGLASVGGVAVVASGMFPSPPFTMLAFAVAFAPLAITLWAPDFFVIMARSKRGGAPKPTLNPVAGIPAAALFFRSVGMDLIDFGPSWIAAGAGAFTFAAAARLRQPVQTPIQLLIYMSLSGLLLGYGAATQADVGFDASPGDPYRATVMDMHESHSTRTSSYAVELSPWGPLTGWNWQDVPHSIYQAVSAGDSLCTRLHPGALHERWFTIDLCTPPTTPASTTQGVGVLDQARLHD
jgi:hypothetical protein